MTAGPREVAVRCLALARSRAGERRLVGWGHGLYAVSHTGGGGGEVVVEVWARTNDFPTTAVTHLPLTHAQAMQKAATGLAQASGVPGPSEIVRIGKELAASQAAWEPVDVTIDGKTGSGLEVKWHGFFAVLHVTPSLVVNVIGPDASRPAALELVTIAPPKRD